MRIRERTILGSLPDTYDVAAVSQVFRDGIARLDRKVEALDRRILPAVPVRAPRSPLPGREEAVEIEVAPDTKLDAWSTTTVSGVTYVGPRRIWSVQDSRVPSALLAGAPVRYRLLTSGVEFTVFSCRMLDELADLAFNDSDQTGTRWEVTYGLIIKGIPNYLGYHPRRVTALYEGYPTGSAVGVGSGVTPAFCANATRLHEAKATEEFETNRNAVFTVLNRYAAAGWMQPDYVTTNWVDEIDGFDISLISGSTADEVYAQMNSLQSYNLSWISGGSSGPRCPANVAVVSSASQIRARSTGGLLATEQVVEGIPIRYAECSALIPKVESFSVALTVRPSRILYWEDFAGVTASPTDDQRPGVWGATGVKLANTDRRQVGIDIIVE